MGNEALGARDFWLPEDVILAIGKVTVAAVRLEHGAHLLLEVLWGEPSDKFSDVGRDVKRQIRMFAEIIGIEDDAVDPVLDWVDRAKATMRERNHLLHSAPFQTPVEGTTQVGWHIRDGELWDLRTEDVTDLAGRLRDLTVECMQAVLVFTEIIPERPENFPDRGQGDT